MMGLHRIGAAWFKAHGRDFVRLLGLALGAAGAVFVGWQIWTARADLLAALASPRLIALICIACVVYAASRFLIFAAWFNLLHAVSLSRLPVRSGLYIAAVNTLLKYLPGNVAQHAWRLVYLHQLGFDPATIIWSSVMSVIGLSIAAAMVALGAGGPLIWGMIGEVDAGYVWLAGLVVVFAAAVTALALRNRRGRTILARLAGLRAMKGLVIALSLQIGFFLMNGVAVFALGQALTQGGALELAAVMAAFSGAWIAGFLTPGAPAGLGVREALMVFVLTQATPMTAGDAAVLALLARAVSLMGDAAFAGPIFIVLRRPA